MNAQEILKSMLPARLDGRTIERNGEPYIVLEPLVESMGLDWPSQYRKLAEDLERWDVAVEVLDQRGDGEARPMVCLPLTRLPGWLMEVDPSQVRPEITAWLIGFQAESLRALQAYWDQGVATKARAATQPDADVQLQQTMQAVVGDHHRRMAIVKEAEAELSAKVEAFDRRAEATRAELVALAEMRTGGTRTVH